MRAHSDRVAFADVHYEGRVQGVGFRWQTRQAALQFEVCGTVRNLPDGRVHLQVEGPRDEIERFLAEVARQMEGYIREANVRWDERAPQFKGFEITG